jgi:DNA-binding CsgD family transcriptional regulator
MGVRVSSQPQEADERSQAPVSGGPPRNALSHDGVISLRAYAESSQPGEGSNPAAPNQQQSGREHNELPPQDGWGRETELAALRRLLDRGAGHGGALVISGEAGIGKSFLLAAARADGEARNMQILRTIAVECETNLPFAGLHQLLRPLLSGCDRLHGPQRECLEIAFGITRGSAPELFLVALATLSLMSDAAAHSPMLVLVDDAHWLDRASADVLTFVGRRLDSDPIVLLLSVREGFETPFQAAGIAELELTGLEPSAASDLLDRQAEHLAPALRKRVLETASGNPLALVELPRALEHHEDLGRLDISEELPLTRRLEQAFASRLAGLPADTQTLLLVAALNDRPAMSEALDAAGLVLGERVPIEALAPASAVGLTEAKGCDIRFRHPLARSAIRQAAGIGQQQAASRALADVAAADPDRSAWHRAAAAIGPEELAAGELDAAAERARARGSLTSAVAALERAVALSEQPSLRTSRLLKAADLALELGRIDIVSRLVQTSSGMDLSEIDAARVALIRELAGSGSHSAADAAISLVRAAEGVFRAGESDLALDLLLAAATRSFSADLGWDIRRRILHAAERLAVPEDEPRLLLTVARSAPVERADAVIERATERPLRPAVHSVDMCALGNALAAVGAQVLSEDLLTRASHRMREEGRLRTLTHVLALRAWAGFMLGNWSVAASDAEEASGLALETGQPIWASAAFAARAMLAAVRGDLADSEAWAAEAEALARPAGAAAALVLVQMARGMASLGAGRHDDAYRQIKRVFDPADPSYHSAEFGLAIGMLAEVAAFNGCREEARETLEGAELLTSQTSSPWLHVSVRHARALLASDVDAELLYEAGLDSDTARWPFERARLQLAYGAWLRRQRRPADSRAPLRAARDGFDGLGATPWGDRARQELRAAGEKSRQRAASSRDELSPQELQIARMAGEGLSNREIAQRLYISHRTVGFHLYKTFPKLGVTSRTELRDVLDSTGNQQGDPHM